MTIQDDIAQEILADQAKERAAREVANPGNDGGGNPNPPASNEPPTPPASQPLPHEIFGEEFKDKQWEHVRSVISKASELEKIS